MKRKISQTAAEIVAKLKEQTDLSLSQGEVEKFLVKLGYAESGAGSIISMGVKLKKFRRFRHPEMGTYLYLKGAVIPDGATDYGYSMLKARGATSVKKTVETPSVQLRIPYGKGEVLLLEMHEARTIYDQLGQVFG